MVWTLRNIYPRGTVRIDALEKNGRCDAEKFLHEYGNTEQGRVLSTLVKNIAHKGLTPRTQYKYERDDIWVMKAQGLRLYYFYHQRNIILTNGAKKPAHKVQTRDINKAIRRKEEYLESLK